MRPARLHAFLLIATLMLAAAPASAMEETRTFGRFGEISLYHETPHPTHVVLFVSGDGGWNQGVVDMARDLAHMDALVVGVDVVRYLKALESSNEECSYPASDFEELSQFVQRELGYPNYVAPVLVGYSSGATLVYAILVQAPPATFRGAISLGFCPDLPITKPLCRGSGLDFAAGPKGKGVTFLPASHLETPWIALQGAIDQVCDPMQTQAFVAKTARAEVVMLPKVGHGFSVAKNWLPQFEASFRKVVSAPSADPTRAASKPASSTHADALDVSDLPLVEVRATGTARDELAIHLTGDGGWGVTDKGIANELAAAGVPVVGWNALHYFWKKRDPEQTTRDLERVIRHYLAAWNKERVILIGYSFGADVLPIVYNRLPADLKARVPIVVLLGPAAHASFEFHVADWLGHGDGDKSYPVAPEIARMDNVDVFCFYGQGDKDAICAELDPARVTIVSLDGGHRIGTRFDGIVRQILGALPQAASKP